MITATKNNIQPIGFVGLLASIFALLISPNVIGATTVMAGFSGNDCSGYFGKGFDSCTIFIGEGEDRVNLSPVIAKYKANLTLEEVNNTVFPSVGGSEYTFSNTTTENKTGEWAYTPGAGDPATKYWVTKAGNGFKLFWTVADALTSGGGVCNSATADSNYNLECLLAAQTVTAGSWITPGDKGLSHITFYDTGAPVVIPVPGAVLLFGSGLLGLVGFSRRKRMAAA